LKQRNEQSVKINAKNH
jgi:ankyrin repeat protein